MKRSNAVEEDKDGYGDLGEVSGEMVSTFTPISNPSLKVYGAQDEVVKKAHNSIHSTLHAKHQTKQRKKTIVKQKRWVSHI